MIQHSLSSGSFSIYTNPDVVPVELDGAVKNVVAIAGRRCARIGLPHKRDGGYNKSGSRNDCTGTRLAAAGGAGE
jgi:hypothetical protein